MKRAYPRKRRDRRANLSPYVCYGKRPVRYSEAYYEWRRSVTKHVAHGNVVREAKQHGVKSAIALAHKEWKK